MAAAHGYAAEGHSKRHGDSGVLSGPHRWNPSTSVHAHTGAVQNSVLELSMWSMMRYTVISNCLMSTGKELWDCGQRGGGPGRHFSDKFLFSTWSGPMLAVRDWQFSTDNIQRAFHAGKAGADISITMDQTMPSSQAAGEGHSFWQVLRTTTNGLGTRAQGTLFLGWGH